MHRIKNTLFPNADVKLGFLVLSIVSSQVKAILSIQLMCIAFGGLIMKICIYLKLSVRPDI